MRVLPDVNILVRANEQLQGRARCSRSFCTATRLVCDEILFDLARVLRYPRMHARYALTEVQMNVPMRDRKDIVVLQTAITGEAEIICTLDTDFYDLPDRTVSASAPQFHRAGVHRVPVS